MTTKSSTSSVAPLGVRKVERPRPLRSLSHVGHQTNVNLANAATNRRLSAQDVSTVEEIIQLLEQVESNLKARNYDKIVVASVVKLNVAMKSYGSQVELFHRELLDRAQVALRNACKDTSLDIVARLHLLEIIELRSMKWVLNESVLNYYRQKLSQIDVLQDHDGSRKQLNANAPTFLPVSPNQQSGNILDQLLPNNLPAPSVIAPGKFMISSGKYSGPTQPQGKSYFKDEVIIRNSDSGKVMGVKGRRVHMIEEMSDTIISFQRVPQGSSDRLVQITGTDAANVGHAKHLMEDTIRRNQSPLPESMAALTSDPEPPKVMSGGDNNEYKFTVKVGDEIIKITSSSLSLVKSAKIVLDDYFSHRSQQVVIARQPLFPDSTKEAIVQAESEDFGGWSKHRRDNFAKTAINQTNIVKSKSDVKSKRVYDRDFLLSCSQFAKGNAPGDWDRVATEFPELVKRVKCAHHDLRCLTNCFELNQQNQELNPMKMVDLRPNMPIRIWNEDSGQWVHETNTQHSRT